MKIIFLSCEKFHAMARIYHIAEQQAIKLGLDFIEAVAHPTIAEYAHRKHGFAAPGVYIVKALHNSRSTFDA